MKFAFIHAEKACWPVLMMCEVLDVSPSGYCVWRDRPLSSRASQDAQLLIDMKKAHHAGKGCYGSPHVHRALRRKGVRVGKKRIERLMRCEGLTGRRRKPFCVTTNSKHASPVADNVLARNFHVEQPNKAWVTDVTYVWTMQGWLYLAAIIDLYSRRVVGWSAGPNNDTDLALAALKAATRQRNPEPGFISSFGSR